jgi:hypothetical protein
MSRFTLLLLAAGITGTTHTPRTIVTVRLSEWKVEASAARTDAGPIAFAVTNAGTIPHSFEVEGRGLERRTRLLQPGQSDTLQLTLRAGRYELIFPGGDDWPKHLGMLARLEVGASAPAPTPDYDEEAPAGPRGLDVIGGGPVVQILPGPFPFADSAAQVIAARPADQQADLHHKAERGPYSNSTALISGAIRLAAFDLGGERDSVAGTADFTTQDGARWRLVVDRVQTQDIPFNPRFGGVIMGLYYHGASGLHTPLVPTIKSTVALWAFAHLYKNDVLVTDTAMVHVMLLSRTRTGRDFHVACWDCSRNPVEELQLQVTPAPGTPAFDAPGGFLFVNWERSRAATLRVAS